MAARKSASKTTPKSLKSMKFPGVTLVEPKGGYTSWRARFVDPHRPTRAVTSKVNRELNEEKDEGRKRASDLRRFVFVTLTPQRLRDDGILAWNEKSIEDAVRRWAEWKSSQLAEEKAKLAAGGVRKEGTSIVDAFEFFYANRPRNTKGSARTEATYRECTNEFVAWAEAMGIVSIDDINKATLLAFRDAAFNAPHKTSKSKTTRSVHTVNRTLRAVSTALRFLLDRNRLASLSADDLKVGLARKKKKTTIRTLTDEQPAALLRACIEYDRELYKLTREEHRANAKGGSTPRHAALSPFVMFLLLSGVRFSEGLQLDWSRINLDARSKDGSPVGRIALDEQDTKTGEARLIRLDVSPTVRDMLDAFGNKRGTVFNWLSRDILEAGRKRLLRRGAPKFTWKMLRSTCASYLTNASSIFGASSATHSARRMGHSVTVAERHYVGSVEYIPDAARTLEAAMEIEVECAQVVQLVRERFGNDS